MEDKTFEVPGINKAICLQKYNDNYELLSMWRGNDGEWKKAYTHPSTGYQKPPKEKAEPVKIKIGDCNAAIKVLSEIIEELSAMQGPGPADAPKEEDILF